LKRAIRLCLLQILNYGLICFSYRLLAQGDELKTVATDVAYSILGFSILREVARGDDSFLSRAGYTIGSGIGTYLGIVISKMVTGR
jgi:hypothetical protein